MLRIFIGLLLVISALLLAATFLLQTEPASPISASLDVAEAMGGDTTGYHRATTVRPFSFPVDFGEHPEYKTEWWYFTGNLETSNQRHFGYELTIFRFALSPSKEGDLSRASEWAANQLYMGHFALADIHTETFHRFERFSRGAAKLAGARASPPHVWLEDWSMESSSDSLFPLRIRAQQDEVAIDFTLEQAKPMVLQGEQGLDKKGPEPGNASYYYSFTRLPTTGSITLGDESFAVEGLSWKDHEWSTSALGEDQVGWDWFALQLSNGMEIMYYQLRQRDGTPSAFTGGTVVLEDGGTLPLKQEDVVLDVLDTWESPHSQAVYPARWRFQIPSRDLDLEIVPYMADQELDAIVRYWEGAVYFNGTLGDEAISGSGYVELTGYEGREGARSFFPGS